MKLGVTKQLQDNFQSALSNTLATALAILFALLPVLPLAYIPTVRHAYAGGGSVQLYKEGNINYSSGSWNTHIFNANDGRGWTMAYCVEPAKNSPDEGTYEKTAIDTPSGRNFELTVDLWFAFGGPGFDMSMWPSTNWNGNPMGNEDYYLASHILLADTYSSSAYEATYGADQAFRDWIAWNITGFDINTGELINPNAVGRRAIVRAGEIPPNFETFQINGGSRQTIAASSFFRPIGTMKMKKQSANAEITDDNPCYSLSGIEYGLYNLPNCREGDGPDDSLKLDEDGYASVGELYAGMYFVREKQSSVVGTGYAYDPTVYSCPVASGLDSWVHQTQTAPGAADGVDVVDVPMSKDVNILVQKCDALTMSAISSGEATLDGALFKVEYFDNLDGNTSGSPRRSWTFRTDEQGRVDLRNNAAASLVSGDELYRTPAAGEVVLPLGTYRVRELVAPTYYELPANAEPVTFTITAQGTGEHDVSTGGVLDDSGIRFYDAPVRHDLSFTKRDMDTQRPMSGIPFLISRVSSDGRTIERHVAVTDANGMFQSSTQHANHTTRTNANDNAVRVKADGSYAVDEGRLDADAGIWFGTASDGSWIAPDNSYGAFPDSSTSKYVFEELPVAANEGKSLVSFEAYAHAAHSTTIDLGTVGNITPTLATNACDGADGDKLVSRDIGAVVNDEISYTGLIAGRTYTIRGSLVDAASGNVLVDARGNAISSTMQFTARASSGTVVLAFEFDASTIPNGTQAVACEALLERNRLLAIHNDLEDGAQTVTIVQPALETTASDALDGDTKLTGDVDAAVNDHVLYSGLTPGEEYVLAGTIMDKASGQPFISPTGETSTQIVFTPESSSGSLDMSFSFDAAELSPDTKLVVFEQLYHQDRLIASHEDIDDEGQTVSVFPPYLKTRAADPYDGDTVTSADAETAIVDSVSFSGLQPGREYLLEGTLIDKETGRPMLDSFGREITASHAFVPTEPDGITEVTFSFDAVNFDSAAVGVVFEELYRDGRHLASHIDLEDAAQTILIDKPSIQTFASVDGVAKSVMRDENVSITDTVSYRNLKVGKTYKVEGTLMDKTSKTPVVDREGKQAQSSLEFVANATTGTVEVPFCFDTTGFDEGDELVVFETLSHEGVTLACHEDLDDKRQAITISRPKLSTIAKSEHDTKEVVRDVNSKVVDTVSYESLLPGNEYTLEGKLMDKESGLPLVDAKDQEVSAETSFTPDHANGEITLTFAFDASKLEAGTRLVAFESLRHEGVEIAAHADINDAAQSITVEPVVIFTKASDPTDGDQAVLASEKVRILDSVTFEGLEPGASYQIEGTLMDKRTKESLLDAQGNTVKATKDFMAEHSDGIVEMSFSFDGSDILEDMEIVVFEELYRDEELIATHADIDNISQTMLVTPPQIRTFARDETDGDQELGYGSQATIIDTVEYTGLIAGESYGLSGRLMINDGTIEGSEALDAFGVPITAHATFVPEASHGSTELSFDIDTSIFKEGTRLVAFETLTHNGTVQATHEDIQDENQTVSIVTPGTHVFGKTAVNTPTKTQTRTPTSAVYTGDTSMVVFAVCAALSMMALIGLIWLRYRIVPREKE